MEVQQLEGGDELPIEKAAQHGADDLAGGACIEVSRLAAERDGTVVAADGQRRFRLAAAGLLEEDFARRGETVVANPVTGDADGIDLTAGEEGICLAEDGSLDPLEIRPPETAVQLLAAVTDDFGDLPALLAACLDFVSQLAALKELRHPQISPNNKPRCLGPSAWGPPIRRRNKESSTTG